MKKNKIAAGSVLFALAGTSAISAQQASASTDVSTSSKIIDGLKSIKAELVIAGTVGLNAITGGKLIDGARYVLGKAVVPATKWVTSKALDITAKQPLVALVGGYLVYRVAKFVLDKVKAEIGREAVQKSVKNAKEIKI